MRIAVLILGLLLGLLMFFQTFVVYALSGAASQQSMSEAGAVGLLMAVLWLIACALVIPIPLVSTIVFLVAGLLGVAAAGSSKFSDLSIWGGISFILAVLSFIGWVGKRRGERRAEQRHQELLAAARGGSLNSPNFTQPLTMSTAQGSPAAAGIVNQPLGQVVGPYCTNCGTQNPVAARFCANCGASTGNP